MFHVVLCQDNTKSAILFASDGSINFNYIDAEGKKETERIENWDQTIKNFIHDFVSILETRDIEWRRKTLFSLLHVKLLHWMNNAESIFFCLFRTFIHLQCCWFCVLKRISSFHEKIFLNSIWSFVSFIWSIAAFLEWNLIRLDDLFDSNEFFWGFDYDKI